MRDLRTICVGTDFSPESDAALRSAINLARSFGARLAIVTVVEPPPLYERIVTPVQSRLVAPKERAAEARKQLKELTTTSDLEGLRVSLEARVGTPFVELIGAARAIEADLLVVGSRQRSGVERMLLGSTAERVLRKAPVPVLVAKNVLAVRPSVVLATTDFSPSSRPAVEQAITLAKRWEAKLALLHVLEPIAQTYVWPAEPAAVELFLAEPEDLEPEWQTFLGSVDLSGVVWEKRTLKGYAVPTIVSTASELGAQLIALGTHGRSGLMHLLLGSVAERVAREARCSVLYVRPAQFRFALP